MGWLHLNARDNTDPYIGMDNHAHVENSNDHQKKLEDKQEKDFDNVILHIYSHNDLAHPKCHRVLRFQKLIVLV